MIVNLGIGKELGGGKRGWCMVFDSSLTLKKVHLVYTYVDEHVCAYASVYANDRVTGQCSRQDCASQLGVLETRFGEYQSFFESLSCSEVLMLRM